MGNAGSNEVSMERDLGQFVITNDGIKLSTSVLEKLAGTEEKMIDSYEKVIDEQEKKIQQIAQGWKAETGLLKKELQRWERETSVREVEYQELKNATEEQSAVISMLKQDLSSWEDVVNETKQSLAKAQDDSKKWAAEAQVRSQIAEQLKSSLEKAQLDREMWVTEAESRSELAEQLKSSLSQAQADSDKWAAEAEARSQLAQQLKESLTEAQEERNQLAEQLGATFAKAQADSELLTSELETRTQLSDKLLSDVEALKSECENNKEASELGKKLKECELASKTLANENAEWKVKVESSQMELASLQEQYTNLNTAYVAVQNLVVDKEGQIAEIKSQSEQTGVKLEKWKSDSAVLEGKALVLQEQLDAKNLDFKLMEHKADELMLVGDKLQTEIAESTAEQQKLKNIVSEQEITAFKLEEQLKTLGAESDEMQQKVKKCAQEIAEKAGQVEKWKSDYVSERARWIERREMVADEYNTALKDAESKFQKPLLQPICQHLQSALVNCYQNNSNRVLNCSEQLLHFKQCVEDAKRSLIDNK